MSSWYIKIIDDYIDLSSNDNIKDANTSFESINDHSVDDLEYIQTNLNNIDNQVSEQKMDNNEENKQGEEDIHLIVPHQPSLVDLPIVGHCFTWMNKAGTKLSKLDRFLILEDVIDLLSDIRITALDRIWSDHNLILLHVDKINFGPSPFKLYNSWLLRDDFDDLIKSKWDSIDSNNSGFPIKCYEKFCILKAKIWQWNNNNKTIERNRKVAALEELSSIEKKIDEGSASPSDMENRLNLLHELEIIDKFVSMDCNAGCIAGNAGCIACNIPFNYLGLPIGSNMKSIASWKMLIDRFCSRLSTWKASLLSIGGRLTLIKSVLESLGIYDLERIRSNFFWGGNQDGQKMAWVKWPIILNSYDNGGLNIDSLKAFNLVLLQNWRWRFFTLQMIYELKSLKLFMVMKVVLIIMAAVSRVHGLTLLDPQTSFTRKAPLSIRYNRLYRLDQDKDCLIIDRIINRQWHWNWSRTNIGVRNLAFFRDMLNEIGQLNIVVSETMLGILASNGTFNGKGT
ncbi:RNA-directed DNA polymerase, eukaryota, reverse transcriptase zinc-binding domain protein [Tanacetum coccineum]